MLMENFLKFKEYWQVVSDDIPESVTMTDVQKTKVEAMKLKDLRQRIIYFKLLIG